MKMLLLGFSDLFQRKVAQVWLDSPLIDTVDIATRSRSEQARNFAKLNTLYTDYQQAVTESDADVAYISTTNDLHPHYTELCLSRGMHTLVDKPIMATDAELARIMALAEERRLCV